MKLDIRAFWSRMWSIQVGRNWLQSGQPISVTIWPEINDQCPALSVSCVVHQSPVWSDIEIDRSAWTLDMWLSVVTGWSLIWLIFTCFYKYTVVNKVSAVTDLGRLKLTCLTWSNWSGVKKVYVPTRKWLNFHKSPRRIKIFNSYAFEKSSKLFCSNQRLVVSFHLDLQKTKDWKWFTN